MTNWRGRAMPHQIPPAGDWRIWAIVAGRGGGKTWAAANWIIEQAKKPNSTIALLEAGSYDHQIVRDTLLHCPPDFTPRHELARQRLVWENGTKAYYANESQCERLRCLRFDAAWINNFEEIKNLEAFDILRWQTGRGKMVVGSLDKVCPAVTMLLNGCDVVATGNQQRIEYLRNLKWDKKREFVIPKDKERRMVYQVVFTEVKEEEEKLLVAGPITVTAANETLAAVKAVLQCGDTPVSTELLSAAKNLKVVVRPFA
jgi:hypothetical protein